MVATLTNHDYNGTSRLAKVKSTQADVHREMFSSTGNYDSWDRFGRTLKHRWERTGGTQLDEFTYTYDYAGNRLTRNITGDSTRDQTFTYDGLYRLESVDESTSGMQREWEYDQLGNWDKTYSDLTQTTVETDRTHNEANELTGFTTGGWAPPAHDDAGNMTTIPKPKDLTNGYTAKYDAWNRLVELKDETSTVVTTNEYDGLHRRIVRDEKGGSGALTHFYYNAQWQCLTETDGTTATAVYSYHPVPDSSYTAVAEVLAYVYQLKGKKIPGAERRAA